jgi:hypothetical protein
MKESCNRRIFIKTSAFASIVLRVAHNVSPLFKNGNLGLGKRVGIIGLDTSHSVEFTKELNAENASPEYEGLELLQHILMAGLILNPQ